MKLRLDFPATKNVVEYNILTFGMEFLISNGATKVTVQGDSLLVVWKVYCPPGSVIGEAQMLEVRLQGESFHLYGRKM